jgi:hypothetical protein
MIGESFLHWQAHCGAGCVVHILRPKPGEASHHRAPAGDGCGPLNAVVPTTPPWLHRAAQTRPVQQPMRQKPAGPNLIIRVGLNTQSILARGGIATSGNLSQRPSTAKWGRRKKRLLRDPAGMCSKLAGMRLVHPDSRPGLLISLKTRGTCVVEFHLGYGRTFSRVPV